MLPVLSRSRTRRRLAAFASAALLSQIAVLSTPAVVYAQPAPNAKASLADAEKAVRAKDWATAAKLFDAANKATPSSEALEGFANASYQGGQFGEAFNAYTEWLEKYGPKAPGAKKTAAQTKLKDLESKTGLVAVQVNEAGATVLIDDRQVGVSPIPAARVSAGPRKIKVTKDGFLTAERDATVTAGQTATVQLTLTASATKGKVTVKEKSGKAVRVIVDGVDMGDAPWSGDLDPGQHEITVRGTGLGAMPQKVTVERGKAQDVEVEASSSTAPVKIATTDGKGIIYLDGKLVGEGSFVGDIPAGTHKLRITREGYDPFEEDITLKDKEPYARSVTMNLSGKISTGPVIATERLEGLYGGFNFLAMFTPGGTNSELESRCEGKAQTPALASCETPDGFGGGFGGFIGYHWDPVGIELFLAGQYDQRTSTFDWNAPTTDLGIGPDPARIEEYNLRRLGLMGLARVRVTHQWEKIRLGLALGAGLSRRIFFLERDTRAKDNSGAKDIYVSDSAGYWSFVVGVEPTVMYRLTRGVAVAAGMQLLLDAPNTAISGNDGANPRTTPSNPHSLGGRGIDTRAFDLAKDLQVYVGPTLGMMFGP